MKLLAQGEKMTDRTLKHVVNNPCYPTSIIDAVKMLTFWKILFAIAFVLHGIYILCTGDPNSHVVEGIFYVCIGGAYGILAESLMSLSYKRTVSRCQVWIATSIIVICSVLVVTVYRNLMLHHMKKPINGSGLVWIGCGLFLHLYSIWIVWACMKEFETTCQPCVGQSKEVPLENNQYIETNESINQRGVNRAEVNV